MELKNLLHTTARYATILQQNGIATLKDFFNNFPRTYEDRSQIKPLDELIFDDKGKTATKGFITSKTYVPRGKGVYDIKFQDEKGNTGVIMIFNSGFLASKIEVHHWYIIVGKPQITPRKVTFTHPDVIPAMDTSS